jgi:hypothetical protein
MSVDTITDFLPLTSHSLETTKKNKADANKAYLILAILCSHLNGVVHDSWQTFGETTREVGKTNAAIHRAREIRNGELVGQRKEIQARLQVVEYGYKFAGSIAQPSKYHIDESSGSSFIHRHLLSAV